MDTEMDTGTAAGVVVLRVVSPLVGWQEHYSSFLVVIVPNTTGVYNICFLCKFLYLIFAYIMVELCFAYIIGSWLVSKEVRMMDFG